MVIREFFKKIVDLLAPQRPRRSTPMVPPLRSRKIPEDELAYHEAGHAVIATVLGSPPDFVTIEFDGESEGNSGYDSGSKNPGLLEQIMVSFAGYLAQVRFAPCSKERAEMGSQFDFEKARRFISINSGNRTSVEHLEDVYKKNTEVLIEKNWSSIQRVAEKLSVVKILKKDELIAIVQLDEKTS